MSKERVYRVKKKTYPHNYTLEEVEGLIDHFSVREAFTDKTRWLVRFADIERALNIMPPVEYEALYLVGIVQIPLRIAAKHLGISKSTMWNRYNRGLEWVLHFLNTGQKKRY